MHSIILYIIWVTFKEGGDGDEEGKQQGREETSQ